MARRPKGKTSRRARICLVMIVKDEAEHIERCLTSALPLIDRWAIVDTGSTDKVSAVIVTRGNVSLEPILGSSCTMHRKEEQWLTR